MQMEWPNAGDNCYELPSAFCQQLEMQMEAANPPDVEQAFRVRAFRSVPVPFPFRSSFCVRAGLPWKRGTQSKAAQVAQWLQKT